MDGRQGVVAGNDFSEEGIRAVTEGAILSAQSAPVDPAHDIAPRQEKEKFCHGVTKPDFDRFFERMKELLADVKNEYPKIQIQNIIGEYESYHVVYRNSNGTDFEEEGGNYSAVLEFAGHEGDNTTSLDYTGFAFDNLDGRLIDMANVRYHLDNAQKQLEQIPFTGKFEGSVIFTPECFAEFLMQVRGNFLSDSSIIDGTSIWKDKIGQQVASPCLSVTLKSSDPRIVDGQCFTSDGYRTEDVALIENGILKSLTIGLYAANKTGRPVTRNSSSDLVVANGSETLEEMVSKVEKGLIVGGFSGGQPSGNGDFSGVAKNSYYIENGRIVGAVSETMINGNLASMLMDIRGISEEVLVDGAMVVPYVCAGGVVISGK